MATHERVLYLGGTPGDYRQFSGGRKEWEFEGDEVAADVPVDFDTIRFEVIVFRPDQPLTRDEALARLRELLEVRPVVDGDGGMLYGPGGLVLNLRSRDVHVRGVSVPLTLREFELLRLLLEHRGEVLTADDIARSIWGYETFGSRNFVESHVSRLRAKLARGGDAGAITTVRGVGYIVLEEADVPVGE